MALLCLGIPPDGAGQSFKLYVNVTVIPARVVHSRERVVAVSYAHSCSLQTPHSRRTCGQRQVIDMTHIRQGSSHVFNIHTCKHDIPCPSRAVLQLFTHYEKTPAAASEAQTIPARSSRQNTLQFRRQVETAARRSAAM